MKVSDACFFDKILSHSPNEAENYHSILHYLPVTINFSRYGIPLGLINFKI